ncbi:prophage tail fiber N-terminal domain-containing protein [Escherichia marmotae]|uniref:prophage tail fiber N-terminal domain-containing protein n=3 Tax=Escherichia TaxID=561 RepID=UPI0015F6743A|nr:prophage tail fiber N-terminal domain-containing protein [Escherichia marmotae]MBA7739045.1 prophage tail fiber N-terminal domain-containing protein [Escherichia marmotae]MBA7953178.1 prophage tail fiber N-terminal domain-containing protein [Escherichia marmotae]
MSAIISGALIDGAGIPMSGCHIILKSRVNTSEVVMRTVADVVTGNCGEYSFKAQTGKYCVYLKQDWRDEYCVGDIAVYDDSKPGTLNDFLTAIDEGDLKPDVVKRFEEMVAQAQQSAEAAAESERQAWQHVADAQQIKSDCQTLADNVQQNAEAVAEDKQRVAQLASEVEQNAGQVQQGVQSVTDAVKQAQQAADDSASSAEESKNNADNAALSEQNAKNCADNAAGSAQQTAQDVKATAAARDDAERFADEARNNAVATAADRESTAEDAKQTGQNAAAAAMSAQEAKDAAGHVQGFIHDHLSVSARYSVTEANRQLQALRINSGRYEGLWRYLNANGGINWYFLFLAVYESEGKCFSLSDRMTICEKALRLGLVVPFMTGCHYEAGQRLTINGTLFFVNIAGTTGETLPDISSVAPGDFVRTGSAVLECLKSPSNRIPAAWQYFFLDVAPDLYTPVAPDSTDSYPALWFACIAEFADSTWLQEPAGIGGSSRWEIIKQVAKFNIVAEINPVASLVNVFQHNLAPGDRAYAQCFCQDNAEVYAGLRALKTLADLAGDTTAVTEYTAAMKTIRAGLLALFVPEQKRFLTYYNETDYPAEPGEGRFVDKDRFSVAPWRFGVLETQEEVERYGRQVLDAIQSAYPDLFTANYDGIDTFAMSDFFAFVAKVTTSQTAATAAIRRLQIRATSAVTVADVAAAISVTAWGKIPQFRACDFMRINGHSVLGGGDITLGAAATMEPQSDIRDRTEGRLALPDAFGFGRIFNTNETVRFDSENDFLVWVKQVTPGEYFVDGGSKIISGGVLFNGVVSIRWVEARNNPPEPRYTAKVIIFYGINGDIYYNRYWTTGNGYLTGWERLKLGETGIADTLRSIAGRANNYGYPGIGGVVFAAYCINDMDEDGRIFRGSGVSGSRLAAISVTAPYSHNGLSTSTPQIVIAPPSAYPMAGTFVALSGEPTTKVSAGTSITGLFVRIM